MKPAVLLHDAARLWRAARAHPRQRRAARRLDLGLAFLEIKPASILTARPTPVTELLSGLATYHAAITELGPASREVELVLDLWAEGPGGGTSHAVGHVVLHAATSPRRRLPVRIRTDFTRTAEARWDGRAVACHLQSVDGAGPGRGPTAPPPIRRGPATLFLLLRHQGQEMDRIEIRLPGDGP